MLWLANTMICLGALVLVDAFRIKRNDQSDGHNTSWNQTHFRQIHEKDLLLIIIPLLEPIYE